MTKTGRRMFGAALLVGGLAIGGFVIAQFVGAQSDESILVSGGNAKLVNARDNLSICVDGARGYTATRADVDMVQELVDTAVGRFAGIPSEYEERVVVLGCPPPPAALDREPLDRDLLFGDFVDTQVPSDHRAFIYIIPETVFAPFDPLPYVIGTAEKIFRGDVWVPVTDAVYITPSTDQDAITEALLGATGLQIPPRFLE